MSLDCGCDLFDKMIQCADIFYLFAGSFDGLFPSSSEQTNITLACCQVHFSEIEKKCICLKIVIKNKKRHR